MDPVDDFARREREDIMQTCLILLHKKEWLTQLEISCPRI